MRAPPVAVPAHKGRGTADAAPGPCCPRAMRGRGPCCPWAMRGLPPRLPRLLRRMGASRRPAPTSGGTFGGAGAQRPLFVAPCGWGALRVGGFSHLPPRPLARWAKGEREVTAARGRGRGLLTSARVLLLGCPLRLATRMRSAYKGKRASAPRYISPLDKLPRYLVRYSCEVTPAAFAALPSTSMVRQSPPSSTGGFCYTWDTESATFAASNAPNATKPRYFVAFTRPKQNPSLHFRFSLCDGVP